MSSATDPVRDMIDMLRAQLPTLTDELALQLEMSIRSKWAGDVYIAKRPPAAREKAFRDALTDMPLEEVQRRNGVSRATIYRLLKRQPGTPDGT